MPKLLTYFESTIIVLNKIALLFSLIKFVLFFVFNIKMVANPWSNIARYSATKKCLKNVKKMTTKWMPVCIHLKHESKYIK